jgi:predicted AlkP superfamily phosphohydrolase/phosphomutase
MYMPFLKNRENSPHPEEEFLKLHEATYMMTDEYIGEFLPLIDEGWTLMVFSDHSLLCREHDNQYICDNYGINVGVMSELGYLVMKTDEQGNMIPEIDWEHTRAVQTRANSIFINLKGRDRHGIVDPVDKYELEEQIITDLYGYKDKKTGKRIVALALHQKDANLLGLGGPHASGDIVMFLHDDYAYDHGESLSTAEGYADTSVGPIFVAAGPGIKEGYEMELFPREVDVAPTAAVLLGVRIPAQCEGCPSYSILTEEL